MMHNLRLKRTAKPALIIAAAYAFLVCGANMLIFRRLPYWPIKRTVRIIVVDDVTGAPLTGIPVHYGFDTAYIGNWFGLPLIDPVGYRHRFHCTTSTDSTGHARITTPFIFPGLYEGPNVDQLAVNLYDAFDVRHGQDKEFAAFHYIDEDTPMFSIHNRLITHRGNVLKISNSASYDSTARIHSNYSEYILTYPLMSSRSPMVVRLTGKNYDGFRPDRIPPLVPKGRIQDALYNVKNHMIGGIVANYGQAIPDIIEAIADTSFVDPPVLPYRRKHTVSDLALVILIDLFTDSSWTDATVPAFSRKNLIEGYNEGVVLYPPAFPPLRKRLEIRNKADKIWKEYRDAVCWDNASLCFRINRMK